jgi:DNA-binding XRE family transcriptional regulator
LDSNEFAAWRKRVGITQEELAERWARVTRTTIQNWESGATPIPQAVETACATWERRLKQENPGLGPVTLIFADGPMFIDPYGPRRRLAMMHQEPYPSNTAAIARVLELSGRDNFHNPFIIEKSGEDLWNAVELK